MRHLDFDVGGRAVDSFAHAEHWSGRNWMETWGNSYSYNTPSRFKDTNIFKLELNDTKNLLDRNNQVLHGK